MRFGIGASFLLFAVASLGCGELEDLDAGMCGNGVLEPGEFCDTSDDSCGQPGDQDECQFICDGAAGIACPVGMTCGDDQVCRAAAGTFETSSFIVAPASFVAGIADFDGDDAGDIVVTKPGEVAVYFHDDQGQHVGTSTVPSVLTRPALGPLTMDSSASMVLSRIGVSVMLGETGRTLFPKSYAPFPVKEETKSYIFADVYPQMPGQEVLAISKSGDGIALVEDYLQLPIVPKLIPGAKADASIELTAADFDVSLSCDEIVSVPEGATKVTLFRMCELGPPDGIKYSTNAPATEFALPAGYQAVSPARPVNLNGDANWDLMVQGVVPGDKTSARLLVAYGDGTGHMSSVLPDPSNPLPPDDQFAPLFPQGAWLLNSRFPMAAGQLNGDNVPDFVLGSISVETGGGAKLQLPGSVIVSGPGLAGEGCGFEALPPAVEALLNVPNYFCAARGSWGSAVIGNLNGDDLADVAVTVDQLPKIDFFLGTGVGIFNRVELPLLGSATQLDQGDFDGDLVDDLIFVERVDGEDSVGISFGRAIGGPEIPLRIPGLGQIEQVASTRLVSVPFDFDFVSDIGVVSSGNAGRTAALLYGSTQRFFQSPFEIIEEGTELAISPAIRSLIGNFEPDADGHGDVAIISGPAILSSGEIVDTGQLGKLWLLPSTGEAELSNATKRAGDPLGDFLACGALVGSADLDRDGLDEVVMLGPKGEGDDTQFVLGVGKPNAQGFAVSISQPLGEAYLAPFGLVQCLGEQILNELSTVLQGLDPMKLSDGVQFADLDGDVGEAARPDAVALGFVQQSAEPGDLATKIVIFRNDGQGGLDAAGRTVLGLPPDASGEKILGFAILNADSDPQKELLIVTALGGGEAGNVYLVDVDLAESKLVPIRKLADAQGVTSIAAGDLNKDGVDDIVLAGDWGLEVRLGKEKAP